MSISYMVLTAVGPDRPGLVDILGQYILERGGNVESSRMATLGGEFASIVLVSGEESAVQRIEADAQQLVGEAKLTCNVRRTTSPTQHKPVPNALPYDLSVDSMDHPGIVRAIAHDLAAQGVNIDSLDTTVEQAPHTGTNLFHLNARLSVPAETNIPQFRERLENLAAALNVDVHLSMSQD